MTPLETALISLVRQVEEMRKAQINWYANHKGLAEAKRLEATVDARIKKAKESGLLAQPKVEQNKLFE